MELRRKASDRNCNLTEDTKQNWPAAGYSQQKTVGLCCVVTRQPARPAVRMAPSVMLSFGDHLTFSW